jgi:TonB family protein
MRRFILIAVGCLMLLSICLETPIEAQNRRRGTHHQSPYNIDTERAAREERSKAIDECMTSGRPKPEVENERKGPELCGKAISLPKPAYPEEAKAQGASGRVVVRVVANEKGHVIWAEVIDGHPLLKEASLKAACQAQYSPEKISNRAIKVSHVISYNFVD